MKKKNNLLKSLLKSVFIFLLFWAVVIAAGLGILTATEYRPTDKTSISVITNTSQKPISTDKSFKVLTWNIGYGALGDNADFFMDGGTQVKSATKERVQENLTNIGEEISNNQADVVLLQEVDYKAHRSYNINEIDTLTSIINNKNQPYNSAFANNFKVSFVPYPIPPIGNVDAGIVTLTQHKVTSATRVQLPVPFKWPVRTANLKRCLLINRLPLQDSDKELIIVNLHLEAYDKGEGKIAQTNALKDILEKEVKKGNYVIAGGDFNQTFSSIDTSAYPAQEDKWHAGTLDVSAFNNNWQFLMNNDIPSCRSLDQPYKNADHENFQYYVIDGFIVSKNLQVNACTTKNLDFRHSDHQPVLIECTFKK